MIIFRERIVCQSVRITMIFGAINWHSRYYPSSVLIQAAVMHSDEVKEEARRNAIPEFMRFNIVECEVRNVV